ncbi:MAG: hypothetical protein ABIN91_02395 [Mucilaginibacter sp.]|uniref:hypothetical protein n=1 Tax=Mucilaginibacter sp. TaxID=1882438 RepID=UPI0032645B65
MSNERENKEWLNEYPALSKVSPANAFTVPDNYFEEMEGRIMDEIRLLKFKETNPQDGFKIPENYFDDLTQNIQSRIAIEEILSTDKGFKVPENYFDELTNNIQSRVAIDELLNTDKGFTVPENYFEDLSQNIEARIAVDKLINAEEGFIVPENYFEELEARILQKTVGILAPAQQNKPIVRKLWSRDVFKYAAAACLTVFVGAAVLMSEFNDAAIHNRSDLHRALSKVSKSDLQDYLELSGDSPTLMENDDPNNIPATDTGNETMN